MRLGNYILTAAALAASAQEPGGIVFRTTSNLVVVDVFVRDRSGKDIAGLKRDDFTLIEDGKPQKISVFEFQKLDSEPLPEQSKEFASRTAPKPKVASQRAQTISTAAPGQIKYQDRRLMVLFFDLSSMPEADQIRAQKSARKFLDSQMTAADLVSVMTFGAKLNVLEDFTNDRDRLDAALRRIRPGEASELAVQGDTGDSTTGEDNGAAFVADETEFNIFNTDRKLSALESAAKMLSGLPEKKALVYFSSGVSKTGVENQSQLRSTINAAVRANVSFYPIDARGLVASAPVGNADQASQRGSGIFSGQSQTDARTSFNDQQETLVSLAEGTGGKALLDNNALQMGIVQAQNDIRSYYILGYYSTNPSLDGRYRRIQIKLASQTQAKLDYRSGYFAPKEFGKYSSADKESQLEQALMLGDPVTDLPLAVEVDHFRLAKDRYFVPVAIKIPGTAVALAKKGSNEITEFDFIGQVRDAKGRLVANLRDGIRVKLNEANAARVPQRNYHYDGGFLLSPGQYSLKLLARENQTGRMGTFELGFKIPDLDAKSEYLRVSSVVFGNQREPVAAAVGTAGPDKKEMAANPLVESGTKLIPSVTKVFRKDQSLYVYLEAYAPALNAEKKASLVASVSFFQGNAKVLDSEPVRLTETAAGRPNTLPIRFEVPLAKLPASQYTCQISVVDGLGKKFAFPRARLILLP